MGSDKSDASDRSDKSDKSDKSDNRAPTHCQQTTKKPSKYCYFEGFLLS
ncbi:hypothetical protein [Prevotella ihumii]|nr:hypothetical protein [Prevotella ihumii]